VGGDAFAGQPQRLELRRKGLPAAGHAIEIENKDGDQDLGHPRSGASFAAWRRESLGELWQK
jgi:hypothetical protein